MGKTASDATTRIAGNVGQRHPLLYALIATALSMVLPIVLEAGGETTKRQELRPTLLALLKILFDEDEENENEGDDSLGGREQTNDGGNVFCDGSGDDNAVEEAAVPCTDDGVFGGPRTQAGISDDSSIEAECF